MYKCIYYIQRNGIYNACKGLNKTIYLPLGTIEQSFYCITFGGKRGPLFESVPHYISAFSLQTSIASFFLFCVFCCLRLLISFIIRNIIRTSGLIWILTVCKCHQQTTKVVRTEKLIAYKLTITYSQSACQLASSSA